MTVIKEGEFLKNTPVFMFREYIYRPQRSCGQGNIFTPVCHSVHRGEGVSASVHAGIPHPPEQTPPRAETPLEHTPPPWSTHHPPRSRHPLGSRLRHAVNERPVRILLECILVDFFFENMFRFA